ncbi:MAG: bacteriophage holin [Candidatus Peregrinibacteria bacterium]
MAPQPFNPVRFGLALGLTCAVGVLFLGVSAHYFGWGEEMVRIFSTVYRGYDSSLPGTFFGMGYGIVTGLVTGWLFAWFYNKL